MKDTDYRFAELEQEAVEEIRRTEKRLSEQSGQPITLIAYRADAGQESADGAEYKI